MATSVAVHAQPAKQARSQRSLAKLLSAAEAVLTRDGWDAFTMKAVADESGVSIGGIYRRFANKEQLLRAIKDQILGRADLAQQMILEQSASDLRGAIRLYVQSRIASLRSYSGVLRQVFEGQMRDHVMQERGRLSINLGMRVFRSVIQPHRGEIGHADPDLAIEVAFYIMNAVAMRRVRSPGSDQIFEHIDWEVLEVEMETALAGYLLAQPR